MVRTARTGRSRPQTGRRLLSPWTHWFNQRAVQWFNQRAGGSTSGGSTASSMSSFCKARSQHQCAPEAAIPPTAALHPAAVPVPVANSAKIPSIDQQQAMQPTPPDSTCYHLQLIQAIRQQDWQLVGELQEMQRACWNRSLSAELSGLILGKTSRYNVRRPCRAHCCETQPTQRSRSSSRLRRGHERGSKLPIVTRFA
jgi:hypothetical protein